MELLPLVPLGNALVQDVNYIEAPEPKSYKKLSVKLYGKGVFLDPPVAGSSLKMQRHQIAKAGQVILSEIWGKKGAIGIVPSEGDGALCTSHFFLFDIRSEIAEPGWVDLILKANYLEPQLDGKARGTTGYAAVRPHHLLSAKVPLPAIDKQRLIVAKVDNCLTKLEQAVNVNTEISAGFEGLLVALAHRDDLSEDEKVRRGWRHIQIKDMLMLDLEPVLVDSSTQYPSAGCYSFGRGLFEKPPVNGLEIQATTLYRIRAGQFIYLKLKAFEGAFGYVPPELDGRFVSNEYPTFTPRPEFCRSEWLFAYFKKRQVWTQLATGSKGIGARRERVRPEILLSQRIWVPPLTDQHRIAEVMTTQQCYSIVNKFPDDVALLRRTMLSQAFRGDL